MSAQDLIVLEQAMTRTVGLVSVNVGKPTVIGTRRGKPVWSGIVKHPVAAGRLYLDRLNLEGDAQADLRVHGGIEKAVYAYPSEHLPPWNAELGVAFGPASFGENLTTAGWLEDEVRIGDIWAWGEARLQVCQPRSPCYKLALRTGRPDILKRFTASGRSGWYLRVLEPGSVDPRDAVTVIERDPAGVTVLDAHRAFHDPDVDEARIAAIRNHPALAAAWRAMLGGEER